ncbi:MAG: hypothetical protein HKN23_13310 [Verrucomicrobiales bacterium]|nr:hypothetical protein [Verrucomicrobiales bacterium]
MNEIISKNRPDFADGTVPWNIDEQEITRIQSYQQLLLAKMNDRPFPNDPCPCLSRVKFKKCCGIQSPT